MTPLSDHVKHAKQLMDKAVEAVKREFSTVRTGKATTALLDLVRVEAYGNEMPLTQVASVAAPEPKLLTIQPWDKSLMDLLLGTQGWRRFAEQDPMKFRQRDPAEAERYLVMTGQSVQPTFFAQKEVQKVHDEHLKAVDAAVKAKEAEIMEV